MILLELFGAPYEYETRETEGDYTFEFEADNGQRIVAELDHFPAPGVWIYSFKSVNQRGTKSQYEPTGEGDAPRILATTVKILKDHKDKVDVLMFSMDKTEASRKRLYMSMVKRFAKNFGYELLDEKTDLDKLVPRTSKYIKRRIEFVGGYDHAILAKPKVMIQGYGLKSMLDEKASKGELSS